jgi:hypothetical protein
MLVTVACGTITLSVETDVRSQQEIFQRLEMTMEGPLAALMIEDGEIDPEATVEFGDTVAMEAAGWIVSFDVVQIDGKDAIRARVDQTFTGESAVEDFQRAVAALDEDEQAGVLVPQLSVAETDDEITYRVAMVVDSSELTDPPTPTPVADGSDEFAGFDDFEFDLGLDDDFFSALEDEFEDLVTIKWVVRLPGEVTETNGEQQSGGELTWDLSAADLEGGSRELSASSTVSKRSGGSCN